MSGPTAWTPGAPDSVNPVSVDILLIDDNEDYLFLIRKALEARDPRYRVTGVGSPEEAWPLLEERTFQLVLLDYKFPRGNGLEVIRRLKEKATFVPTVMITAFGDEGLALEAMREGALDFVPKTGDFVDVLPEVVARALERGRIIRERIRTHQALERKNEELSLLLEVAESLADGYEPRHLLETALDRVAHFLAATEAAAWLEEPGGGLELAAGGCGREPRTRALRRALDQREVVLEVLADGSAWVLAPLVSRDAAVGVFGFVVPERVAPDAAERALLVAVGRETGSAVAHARLWQELTETQDYLADLVGSAGDEVVTIDAEGRIRTWNAGAARLYGHREAEVLGVDWALLWPQERKAEAAELARRVLEGGETIRNHETVRRTADGKLLDVVLTLSPLRTRDGSIRGVSCLGKDLTALKLLQSQLVQSEKMAAVGQLISGVAHELNNPLTAVLGYAQLVCAVSPEDRNLAYLQKIATEASRCQRIVHNLLAFARKHEPRAERSDVNQVVRDTLELRSYDLRVNDIELQAELSDELPWTLADAHQLQQVFVNLINNAQQAILADAKSGRLLVRTRHEDGETPTLLIEFHDSGPGVPAAMRQRVFDPFFTTKDEGEGTGLGLSLSYGIVHEHGGTIELVDSVLGGACFVVRLPVVPNPRRRTEVPAEAAEPAHATSPIAPPRHILVIDDQDSVREVFVDLLGADGHEVDTASDGWEALRKIDEGNQYDLLIVDLKMPEFGGDRLFEHLAVEHPELARRVVFSTGDLLSRDTRTFVERHGRRLLEKPFGVEEVRSALISFFEDSP